MQDYFKEVNTLIEELETNKKYRELKDNSETLRTYWNVGKLIIEAQGGETRAKYGNALIKEWSIKLTQKYGKGYNYTNLARFRKFYLYFPILATVWQLSWSQVKEILPLKDRNERNYYVNQVILNSLGVRDLRKLIKSKAFERLSYADKENIALITDTNNVSLTIEDMIKDPILINVPSNMDKIDEKALHKYIIDMLEDKFLELGTGFALVGYEYKLQIANRSYKIDLLFFNVELNAYIVIEVKTRELQHRDISQVKFYIEYVNKNIKKSNHNKTIGILIAKKKNQYVIEYIHSDDIYITTYELIK